MGTTVTGSPPRGPTASRRRGSGEQAAPRARRRFRLLRASTTPGQLWLVRAGLVIGHTATAWFAVNQRAQQLDAAADYGAETQLEIGSGPGTAGTLFSQLESDLEAAIHADQAVFASNAVAGSGAFGGLEAGIIAAALVMAVGCGWGLTRRLAEYR